MEVVVAHDLLEAIARLDAKKNERAYIIGTDVKKIAIWSICCKKELELCMLPIGLRILGTLLVFEVGASEASFKTEVQKSLQDLSLPTDDDVYALVYDQGTNQARLFFDKPKGQQIPVTVLENGAKFFLDAIDYSLVRCAFTIPLTWTFSTKEYNHSLHVLEDKLEQVQISFEDPSRTFFELPKQVIVNQNGLVGTSSSKHASVVTLRELFGSAQDGKDDVLYGRVDRLGYLRGMNNTSKAAPALNLHTKHVAQGHLTVAFDSILCLPVDFSLVDSIALLLERISDQINGVLERIRDSRATTIALHQYPLQGGAQHPLGIWSINDEPLNSEVRASLHELFVQPQVPLFRPLCRWLPDQSIDVQGVLLNVHRGIPRSSIHGKQSLVQGAYGYFHYMQQNINDKGWGCAYRSLQTLASWLLLNHYTALGVPTHREIQETLVRMGDKSPSFVGSTEWIGSMEVGYVLDERYGVAFRTIHCGTKLVDYARDLVVHFETHGTPVMLGGASLAFTLLGVDYNEATGDAAFLVLDPHYAGADDLAAIQTKTVALEGYKAVPCSWRNANAFPTSRFYNMCLPQRPDVI
ncbi:Ufm1-specific protease 2 [Aphanomyces cochlioides]|nr:Ufm1-specific protease 2 [Aphanomyces cochlioides]